MPEWPNGRRLAIFGCVLIIVGIGSAYLDWDLR